jgi:hypothetical protein
MPFTGKYIQVLVTEDLELALKRFTEITILREKGHVDKNTWEDARGYAVDAVHALVIANPEIWSYVHELTPFSSSERAKR